jgi:hypothetical protein
MNDYYVASAAQGLMLGIYIACFAIVFLFIMSRIINYISWKKEQKRRREIFRKYGE